jgi:hypothetical protein
MTTPATGGTLPAWQFFDYVASGDNKIKQWLTGNPGLRAELHSTLLHLGGLRPDQWGKTYAFKWLEMTKYKAAGIGELRFSCDGLAQRPVGTFGTNAYQFVLLIGCAKKGGRYFPSPPHPFDVAVTRKNAYLANPASVEERKPI